MSLVFDSYGAFFGLRDWLTASTFFIVACVLVFGVILLVSGSSGSGGFADVQTLSCFELHDVITEAGETEYTYYNVSGSWEKIGAVYGAKCK